MGGAEARAIMPTWSICRVANGRHQRARVGQVAWGCVGGAEAKTNSN